MLWPTRNAYVEVREVKASEFHHKLEDFFSWGWNGISLRHSTITQSLGLCTPRSGAEYRVMRVCHNMDQSKQRVGRGETEAGFVCQRP